MSLYRLQPSVSGQQHQLGFLPLLYGAAVLGASALGYKLWSDNSDYESWKKTVQPPTVVNNSTAVMPAPRTLEQMTNPEAWSPDIQLQYAREGWKEWARNAIPDLPPEPKNTGTAMWIVAGVTAAAVLVITR